MSNSLKIGAILLVILLLAVGPWTMVWALNTLFPVLNIPYTFSTWLAVIILHGLFKANVSTKK